MNRPRARQEIRSLCARAVDEAYDKDRDPFDALRDCVNALAEAIAMLAVLSEDAEEPKPAEHVTTAEERMAWDRYVAGALADGRGNKRDDATIADLMLVADLILASRRERFGKAGDR